MKVKRSPTLPQLGTSWVGLVFCDSPSDISNIETEGGTASTNISAAKFDLLSIQPFLNAHSTEKSNPVSCTPYYPFRSFMSIRS